MTPGLDPEKLKLGQVSINNDAFDLDLKINDRYQAYSAELVRLALLILTGLAIVWLKLYLPSNSHQTPIRFRTSVLFILAFASTALSAGTALMHRYTAADSLAYHITALRRRARNRSAHEARPSDAAMADHDERKRGIRFKWSSLLLRLSAILLFSGLVLFCLALANFMFGS